MFNQHAIPRLLRLNGISEELSPVLTFTTPKTIDLGQLGSFIGALAQAGAPLFPDQDLENYLRGVAGLPTGQAEEV